MGRTCAGAGYGTLCGVLEGFILRKTAWESHGGPVVEKHWLFDLLRGFRGIVLWKFMRVSCSLIFQFLTLRFVG